MIDLLFARAQIYVFVLSVWAFFDRSINTGIKRTKIDQKMGQKMSDFKIQDFRIFQILKIFIFDIFSPY